MTPGPEEGPIPNPQEGEDLVRLASDHGIGDPIPVQVFEEDLPGGSGRLPGTNPP